MDKKISLILGEINQSHSVLDVGCVNHEAKAIRMDNWLHAHICGVGCKVLGIDIEKDGINEMLKLGYNALVADCECLNLRKKFDVIVAGELLEHLSNPGLFLYAVKIHLKPQGKFIFSVPNAYCFYNILSAIFRSRVPVHKQHKCWYDKITIRQLLESQDFNIVRFEFLPIPKTGRGSFISNMLYRLGFKELSACGFLLVCKTGQEIT